MTDDEAPGEDRRRDPLAFGPFASLRAITDLQLQGIRAASRMAERFTELLEGFGDGAAPGWVPDREPDEQGTPQGEVVGEMRVTIGRMIDLYARLFQQTFEGYANLIEGRARSGARLDAGGADRVVVHTSAGATASGDLWIHNHSSEPVPSLSLRATDLWSTDGDIIRADRVELDPIEIGDLGAQATVRVTVGVTTGPGTPPGRYHGYVLARDLPDQALPVVIVVEAGAGSEGDGSGP